MLWVDLNQSVGGLTEVRMGLLPLTASWGPQTASPPSRWRATRVSRFLITGLSLYLWRVVTNTSFWNEQKKNWGEYSTLFFLMDSYILLDG